MRERDYRQNCSVARAADLLGERWTLLIVRDLLIAPRRFSELGRRTKGMGTNLLAKRLREMGMAGLVTGGGNSAYALTEMGRGLEPVILSLAKWSLTWQHTPSDPDGLHFLDWDLLALKALFVPDPQMERPLLARFEAAQWIAWVKIDKREYAYGLGEPHDTPDIQFRCPIPALLAPDRGLSGMDAAMKAKARRFQSHFPIA